MKRDDYIVQGFIAIMLWLLAVLAMLFVTAGGKVAMQWMD